MIKLICITDENVAQVETDCGKFFGIVNEFHVVDLETGNKLDGSVVDVLDYYTDIDQDWDNEANIISFVYENGESGKLSIKVDSIELIDDNE